MLEYLSCLLIGELTTFLSMDYIISIVNSPISNISIVGLLPDKNLTIDNLKISPIDDHITFGIQI